jgi:steroid 5-alpha reductase family enzyme
MPEFLQLSLYGLLVACLVMTFVWWRQVYTKNAGIVDGWWSYIFGIISILYFFMGSGDSTHKAIITVLVIIWSFRLGTHLLIRNTTHTEEDSRYRKLREEYGANENLYMWRFFIYQAFSNVLLSIPFLIICLDQSSFLSPLVWLGTIVWFIAIVGETVADQQLKAFKKNPANKGKVCQQGLWNYSRHPNYFFEWLIWVGYALIALASPYGWIAIICPVIMYLLLNKVTGIPMLEELAVKSKGEAYIRYQQTTSAFFPWFKPAQK